MIKSLPPRISSGNVTPAGSPICPSQIQNQNKSCFVGLVPMKSLCFINSAPVGSVGGKNELL